MSDNLSRREVLKTLAVTAAAGWAPGAAFGQPAPASGDATSPRGDRRRVLRFAHLTDSHVQPELRADAGLIACLHHAQRHADPAQLIVTGGDLIMDAFMVDAARTKLQWDLYKRIMKDECALPVEHCLGNHDIWGWDKKQSGTTGNEPNYGKKWAVDVLGLPAPYRGFDRAGWRFLVLDSVQPDGELFRGELDPAQFDWLREQLKRTPRETPIAVVSHIPILSSTVFMAIRSAEEGGKEWKIPALAMHMDARKIIALFDEHPNVRLCLSGHTHLLDRVEYNGVTYICDGAICGAWWKGPNQKCPEGYGLVDLYNDGSFEHRYVPYGWNAAAAG